MSCTPCTGCDRGALFFLSFFAVAAAREVCTSDSPSQVEAPLLLQLTSNNRVKPAETLTADASSIDVLLEVPTCDISFADTETGADIQFKIDDQWTKAVKLCANAPAGGVVSEAVRLSGWPSKIRLKARGADAWCIDSITMSTGGYNATVLQKTEGKGPKVSDSKHWIDQDSGEHSEYDVPPLPDNFASDTNPEASENVTTAPSLNVSSCTTRFDERVQAMGYETSDPGTKCVFGLDSRDEGEHCVFDNGVYGTLGWCYTDENRESWGACGESCPLWGQEKILGRKIDKVLKTLNKNKGTTNIDEALHLAMRTTTTTSTATNALNTTNTTNETNTTR